jgi:hypothetical protein
MKAVSDLWASGKSTFPSAKLAEKVYHLPSSLIMQEKKLELE